VKPILANLVASDTSDDRVGDASDIRDEKSGLEAREAIDRYMTTLDVSPPIDSRASRYSLVLHHFISHGSGWVRKTVLGAWHNGEKLNYNMLT
jgi:hypothetical protein